MTNRIKHVLKHWNPEQLLAALEAPPSQPEAAPAGYALPRGINMLMPVELCINRDLLITLLSASIQEIYRHKRATPSALTERELAEMEGALQQQLAFRAWAREHPSTYISIAMYPVSEVDTTVEDLEDLGDF